MTQIEFKAGILIFWECVALHVFFINFFVRALESHVREGGSWEGRRNISNVSDIPPTHISDIPLR